MLAPLFIHPPFTHTQEHFELPSSVYSIVLNDCAVSLCWMHVTTHSCVCLFVCLCADLSLVRFISAELTRGYFLEHNEAKYTERREKVYTCLRIPKELEKVPNMAQNYTIHT